MKLTKQQRKQFQEALLDAFPSPASLRQMVRFELDKNLDSIAMGRNLGEITFNLIDTSQTEGWTADLIKAAREANPGNPTLLAFVQQVESPVPMPSEKEIKDLKQEIPTQDGEAWRKLERLVDRTAPLQDIEAWYAKLKQREGQICRIEFSLNNRARPIGTGFLLGSDVVMTNYHVMESVIKGQTKPNDVTLRFNYKRLVDGKTISHGSTYGLVTQDKDWLIDSSPPHQLDYALLRVDGQPGNEAIGQQSDANAAKRGWIEPPSQNVVIQGGTPIWLLQHPQGEPLQFAIGGIVDANGHNNRITYTTNTEGGSSGSPCFNTNGDLIALHCAGGLTTNEGIRFTAILERLQEQGRTDMLGNQQGAKDMFDYEGVSFSKQPKPMGTKSQTTMSVPELRDEIDKFSNSTVDRFLNDYYFYVYNEIGSGTRKNEKITMLLDYCRRRNALPELQDRVEKYKIKLGIP